MKTIRKAALLLLGIFGLTSTAVYAETLEVKGKGVKFSPDVIFASKGDSIAFRNMASHFVESIEIPAAADQMISEMGADYIYVVKEEGVYFYKCPPHWGARMGGLIVVGDASGLVDYLDASMAKTGDKVAKGYLKKIKKNIEKGKIKLP